MWIHKVLKCRYLCAREQCFVSSFHCKSVSCPVEQNQSNLHSSNCVTSHLWKQLRTTWFWFIPVMIYSSLYGLAIVQLSHPLVWLWLSYESPPFLSLSMEVPVSIAKFLIDMSVIKNSWSRNRKYVSKLTHSGHISN